MGARGSPVRFRLEAGGRRIEWTLGRHSSEGDDRVVLRALARALFDEPGLEDRIEPGRELCRGDEPAWRVPAPGGRDALWIAVGEAPRGATSRAERTVVLRAGTGEARAGEVLVDPALVRSLAARLGRRNDWSVARAGGELVVTVEGHALRGAIAG